MSRRAAAAAFNPAHRLIEQTIEIALAPRAHEPARGRGGTRVDLYRPAPAARPGHGSAYRYPAPGLGRPVAARHDRHGDVLPPRPHHLRRADDGARRHDAGRGAGGDQGHRPTSSTRRRSTSPMTWRWWRRWPIASWSCATAGWSRRPRPARCSASRASTYTKSLWAVRSCASRGAGRRRCCCASTTSTPPTADVPGAARRERQVPRGRTVAVVGEFGLRQVDARARDHRPPAAESGARSSFDGQPLPPTLEARPRSCCAASR